MKFQKKIKAAPPAPTEKVRVVVQFGRVLVYNKSVYRAGELLYMPLDEIRLYNMVEIATPDAIASSAGPAPVVEDLTLKPFIVKFGFHFNDGDRRYETGDVVEMTEAAGARCGQVEPLSDQALANASGPKVVPDDLTERPHKVLPGFHLRKGDDIYAGGMIMQLTAREAAGFGPRVEFQAA